MLAIPQGAWLCSAASWRWAVWKRHNSAVAWFSVFRYSSITSYLLPQTKSNSIFASGVRAWSSWKAKRAWNELMGGLAHDWRGVVGAERRMLWPCAQICEYEAGLRGGFESSLAVVYSHKPSMNCDQPSLEMTLDEKVTSSCSRPFLDHLQAHPSYLGVLLNQQVLHECNITT